MPDYSRDRFPRKPFTKGGSRFGGSTKTMHKAECSKCGDVCEVPFRPNGKKPVFCSNCFVKDETSGPRERREFSPRPSYERPSPPPRDDRALHELKTELESINEKLGRIVRAMEISRAVQSAVAPEKSTKKVSSKKRSGKKA
ncbi:MAG: CxxC-x17-CxxC domain-containing protein [Minisyncoccia bacterium]